MLPSRLALILVVVCSVFWGTLGLALAAEPEQDLAAANVGIQRALAASRSGDLATAKQEYDRYENTWFNIEDGIRARSRDAYVAIEKAMTAVSVALAASPADPAKVADALSALDREQQLFIQGQPASSSGGPAPSPAVGSAKPSIPLLIGLLHDAQSDLARGDYPTAATRLKSFETAWLDVEGEVKTRSAEDYRQTENDMALASSLAAQRSPETATVVSRMAVRLEPYQVASRYGIFDASVILLREGLEALLIVVALLAFLKRSSNGAGQGWVWGGAGVGLVASVLLGLAIRAFFSSIINPSNRELMEGVIGLFAAGMLIYVSYWLHSKASAEGWQRYLGQRTSAAIQGGRLVGLGVLAFLAVFREGAETALFFLGMIGNITLSDLLVGLGIGFGALAVLGFLMTVVGLRIPMRPFFAVASVLVFYLCFKFVGTGIHGLQVAGLVPAPSATYLPAIDPLGMYSTWPTTIGQLLLLVAALGVVLHDRLQRSDHPASRLPAAPSGNVS
jgi:high-affinity iron transporter